MWSMSRVTPTSDWTVLLPGFIIGGIGIGFVNAPLATTAVSTVRCERAGMASGINNTFRQVGIATGIAALGAIFASKVGGLARRSRRRSDGVRRTALHDILLVGAGVAVVGAVLAACSSGRRTSSRPGREPAAAERTRRASRGRAG